MANVTREPSRQNADPGRLTAEMKAVRAPVTPRALRVAIVQQGRVIEERSFEDAGAISIGPSERDTFLVVEDALPKSHRLFEKHRGGRRLVLGPKMKARISTKLGTARELESNEEPVVLEDEMKGRVTVGSTIVLFSFEAVPPVIASTPAIVVKRGLEIDWQLTVIAGFSFLFHFGVLGSLYSDWQDPIVDDNVSVAGLIEALRDLPTPAEVEEQEEAVETPDTQAKATSDQPKTAATTKTTTKGSKGAKAGPAREASPRGSLGSELESISLEMNSVLNARAPSTDRVLRASEVPTDKLDEAARRNARSTGRNDIAFGPSGTVERARPLSDTADGGVEGPASAGRTEAPKGPTTMNDSPPPPPSLAGSELPDAGRVIGGLQGAFRRCYQNGLDKENDAMEGSLRITLKVGANGDVTSATSSNQTGTLSGNVVACMVRRASSAHFEAPKNGVGAVLVVPVSMRRQK